MALNPLNSLFTAGSDREGLPTVLQHYNNAQVCGGEAPVKYTAVM